VRDFDSQCSVLTPFTKGEYLLVRPSPSFDAKRFVDRILTQRRRCYFSRCKRKGNDSSVLFRTWCLRNWSRRKMIAPWRWVGPERRPKPDGLLWKHNIPVDFSLRRKNPSYGPLTCYTSLLRVTSFRRPMDRAQKRMLRWSRVSRRRAKRSDLPLRIGYEKGDQFLSMRSYAPADYLETLKQDWCAKRHWPCRHRRTVLLYEKQRVVLMKHRVDTNYDESALVAIESDYVGREACIWKMKWCLVYCQTL